MRTKIIPNASRNKRSHRVLSVTFHRPRPKTCRLVGVRQVKCGRSFHAWVASTSWSGVEFGLGFLDGAAPLPPEQNQSWWLQLQRGCHKPMLLQDSLLRFVRGCSAVPSSSLGRHWSQAWRRLSPGRSFAWPARDCYKLSKRDFGKATSARQPALLMLNSCRFSTCAKQPELDPANCFSGLCNLFSNRGKCATAPVPRAL